MCTQKWTYDPIWQYRGGKKNETLDGCEVHAKLAKQLYVEHEDGEPPKDRGNPNKGFRLAQGAANALLDHKYEDAILHLRNFRETIANNAKLNPDPDAGYPTKKDGSGTQYTARELADWWMAWYVNGEKVYDTLAKGNGGGYSIQDHVFPIKLKKGKIHRSASRTWPQTAATSITSSPYQ